MPSPSCITPLCDPPRRNHVAVRPTVTALGRRRGSIAWPNRTGPIPGACCSQLTEERLEFLVGEESERGGGSLKASPLRNQRCQFLSPVKALGFSTRALSPMNLAWLLSNWPVSLPSCRLAVSPILESSDCARSARRSR